MEWNNPASMGGLSVPGKLMAALFQSVSTRTAGMNTIDLAACGPITKLLMSVLQFIGAAPGSTGGGVKVTTFAVHHPDHAQRGAGPRRLCHRRPPH